MNRFSRLLFLAFSTGGIALLVVLIAHFGAGEIFAAVSATGWGVLAVSAFHLVPVALDTLAWSVLLPREGVPGFGRLLAMRWIGESVNSLVPSAQVGGDFARAYLLMRSGVPGSLVAASVIVNLTLMVVSLFGFSLAGVVALIVTLRPAGAGVILSSLALLAGGMAGGMIFLQRAGMFQRLVRVLAQLVPKRDMSGLLAGAESLDDALRDSWTRSRQVAASAGWALVGWIAGIGEVWLALHFLGHPVSLVEALILESLLQAVRNGAFFIPGALGVQEGGAVLFGGLLGIPPETALALSLLKRCRELLLGLPGLVAWQIWTGFGLRSRARREAAAATARVEGG